MELLNLTDNSNINNMLCFSFQFFISTFAYVINTLTSIYTLLRSRFLKSLTFFQGHHCVKTLFICIFYVSNSPIFTELSPVPQ